MKILKFLLLILMTGVLFGCGKKTTESTVNSNPTVSETATANGPRRQGRRGNSEQRQKRMEALYAELNLSEAQKVKVQEISEKYQSRRRAIFQSSAGDQQAMQAEMQKMRAEQNQEYKGVLTAEQYEKFIKIMEEQRQNRSGRRRNRG
ncbi:MAG: hypothetical protein AAF573_22595 [Bacteroidota bacterium]